MANKNFNTRIQLKSDTEANWDKATNFIPLKGETIIYSADSAHPFSRLKVGDGVTVVSELPFVGGESQSNAVTGVKGNSESDYRTGNVNITPANLGLGNVDNTSDLDKPISTATQEALDEKVDVVEGKGLSSEDYTSVEKTKLANIEAGAQVNTIIGVKGDSESEYRTGNVNITKANIGLSSVDNTSDANKPISTATQTALNNKISTSLKGAASGVAELDENGKVPTSQLPSFVDDVVEYSSSSNFPLEGEAGKIYVDTLDNKTYRWSGSAYVEISPSLALGETSATAYRGDRGKAAYDHAAAKGSAFTSGLYKITTNAEGHVIAVTPVTKADITALGIPGSDTDNNTTYTITQDASDGHKFTLTGSDGSSKTVTIPDDNTTYGNASASANGLMTATDFKKINVQEILDDTDLNDIRDYGWYRCLYNRIVDTLKNRPTSNAFFLEVMPHAYNAVYQHLIEYTVSGFRHFHRNYYNGTWGAWVEWKLTDTTYSSLAAASGGTDVSLVTTGEKYKWNNKADRQTSTTLIPQANIRANEDLNDYVQIGTYAVGLSSTAETIKNSPTNYAFRLNVYSLNSMIIDTQGTWLYRMQEVIEFSTFKAWHRYAHTEGDAVWQYGVWTPNDTTYSNATTSAAGLMSAADKAKLDNMQSQIDQWKSYTQALRDAMQGYIDNLPEAPGELVTP